ncbi:MAG: AroM family protein [Spirochaetes bacterium]|nr:AroM family protein [Spirochaetota bacterium]
MKKRLNPYGIDVRVEALSPYFSSDSEVEMAARKIAGLKPEFVVLYCIGCDLLTKARFSRFCRASVLLPRSLLGRASAELAFG